MTPLAAWRPSFPLVGRALFFGSFICLVACGSSEQPAAGSSRPAPDPLVTDVGEEDGPVDSKTIDSSGGTLVSSDGRLEVVFPDGALADPTEISLVPLTNTAPGGIGEAYRLEPEGMLFDEPVELRFAYDDADLAGSSTGALGGATQLGDGTWQWLGGDVDEAARTATATTTHFSVFSLVKGFQIQPHDRQLQPGEAANLAIVYCFEPQLDEDLTSFGFECDVDETDLDTTPLLPVPPRSVTWSVNGITGGNATLGTVSGNQVGHYLAPSTAPDPSTVAVSGAFAWGSRGQQLVSADVTIGQVGRVYRGDVSYSASSSVDSSTYRLSGTVTWTESDPGSDIFTASGVLHAQISMEGCSDYDGSLDADGTLYLNVPDDGLYSFSVGTTAAMVDCNGVTVPYTFTAFSPPCDETADAPSIGDPQKLDGSAVCFAADVSWSFVRQ